MIEVKNLVKRYGEFEAVHGVSFKIEKGLIYGFLGPNGAGKSTTMNIITGCLAATEGEVTINGCDIYEDPLEAKSHIGYLPEQPPLYMDMTPEEYLEFVGRAKGLTGEDLYRAIDDAIRKTGLTDYASRIIKNLSKGYKQRVGIAQAIIGNPEIIILDEPTVGLDPRQIIEIRELIKSLSREHTVILSSHILTEISAVCDYVIIISHGNIVASDSLENLTKRYEGKNYVDFVARGEESRIRRAIESIPGVLECETNPGELGLVHARIATSRDRDIREDLFFRFADMKSPILTMSYEEVTLEKVFLELTGDNVKPKSAPVVSDEPHSLEEEIADKMMSGVKDQPAEEKPVEQKQTEADAEEKSEETGKKEKKNKKKTDDGEYTSLFGGN